MTKVSTEEQSNNANVLIADSLPPSELIALKEYYDKKFENANGRQMYPIITGPIIEK